MGKILYSVGDDYSLTKSNDKIPTKGFKKFIKVVNGHRVSVYFDDVSDRLTYVVSDYELPFNSIA